MSNNYYGYFVLDDSQAQGVIQKTNNQLATQEKTITNNKHRLDTYFQWAMHMANIWGTYMAKMSEGTKAHAVYQAAVQGLNIMSAELSIALTVKRAMSDLATPGMQAAGAFQLALAASMQYIVIDMQRLKVEMDELANATQEAAGYFNNYA
jgi:hypothetical protein